jgi:hypothetical protein
MKTLILCAALISGCGTVSAVNFASRSTLEFRDVYSPTSHVRTGYQPRFQIETVEGYRYEIDYCYRTIEFEKHEQGIAIGFTVPLWRKK